MHCPGVKHLVLRCAGQVLDEQPETVSVLVWALYSFPYRLMKDRNRRSAPTAAQRSFTCRISGSSPAEQLVTDLMSPVWVQNERIGEKGSHELTTGVQRRRGGEGKGEGIAVGLPCRLLAAGWP